MNALLPWETSLDIKQKQIKADQTHLKYLIKNQKKVT